MPSWPFLRERLSSCPGETARGLLPAEMLLGMISDPLRAGHGWGGARARACGADGLPLLMAWAVEAPHTGWMLTNPSQTLAQLQGLISLTFLSPSATASIGPWPASSSMPWCG